MTESPDPEPLPFTPVPGRTRHNGWTPDRQRVMLEALAAVGTVAGAARAVGMSARSAYNLRNRAGEDSSFVRAWDRALDAGLTDALTIGLERAMEGEEVPVFYGGRQVGCYRRHDDRLALAVLRAAAARDERRASAALAKMPAVDTDSLQGLASALQAIASSELPPV